VTEAPAESNLRVLITGAGGGVGLACAEAFAARGAELILCDHDGVALTRAAEPFGAFSRYCDAVSDSSIAVFAAEVDEKFDSIDIMINAAGQAYVRALAMVRMTRALLPLLRRGRDRRMIVNIAPGCDCASADGMFPYASSEAAFDRLHEALAEQTRGSAIDVVEICPSLMPARPNQRNGVAQLHETGCIDEASTAERIVELVATARPGWRWVPPCLDRRA
jgi:NAD(P)-dependent dehydrogenase (short-subunit alcohol dehydrogenase family)